MQETNIDQILDAMQESGAPLEVVQTIATELEA